MARSLDSSRGSGHQSRPLAEWRVVLSRARWLAVAALAATVALAAAPKAKAQANGERVLDILRRNDGSEAMRLVGLADGGVEMRFPDGGFERLAVETEPQCATDAGALAALARGCNRASDCEALEPHIFGIDSCVVVLRSASSSGAYGRALDQVSASGRMPDGGACPDIHENSRTVGLGGREHCAQTATMRARVTRSAHARGPANPASRPKAQAQRKSASLRRTRRASGQRRTALEPTPPQSTANPMLQPPKLGRQTWLVSSG